MWYRRPINKTIMYNEEHNLITGANSTYICDIIFLSRRKRTTSGPGIRAPRKNSAVESKKLKWKDRDMAVNS